MRWKLACALPLLVSVGCAADGGNDDSDPTMDEQPGGGGGGGDDDVGPGDNGGEVPEPQPQAGVVYLAHYWSEPADQTDRLIWYRIDGDEPRQEGWLDLGDFTQNLELDPLNDLLAVVSDGGPVSLYKLDRPESPEDAIDPPAKAGTIDIDNGTPVFSFFNPLRQRLYVIVSPPPPDMGPITMMYLNGYDVSDPDNPESIDGFPYSIPPTTQYAIDPARDLLFVVAMVEDTLYGYDLSDAGLEQLPGDPIDLRSLYPQKHQFAFQARDPSLDSQRNRLYAMRAQSILSEVIAFEYPPDVPQGGARYGDFVSMDDIKNLQDPMDVDVPGDQRQNLLGGYQIDIDQDTGSLFFSADAWNGASATALVGNMDPDLEALGPACGDFEEFGCFLRYVGETPGSFKRTDGAMCLDSLRDVMVATSIAQDEQDPGLVHFFRYNTDDLSMEEWLPEGGTLKASALPIGAVCH